MASKSYGRTRFMKFTALHTWIIDDFSSYPYKDDMCFESDSFITRDEDYQWKLMLYPGRQDQVHVSLTVVSSDNPVAMTRLWIVDEKKMERNVLTLGAVCFKRNTSRELGPVVSRQDLFDVSNGLLPDDTLTLCCEVTLLVPNASRGPEIPPPPTLHHHIGQLLEKQIFSDVVLVVGEKEFHVHKAVLAARSPVFHSMFQCKTKESCEDRVVIEDLSPEVAEEMLRYVYTNAVENLDTVIEGLLQAAFSYNMEGLRSLCKEWIWRWISVETAVESLRLAKKHGLTNIKDWIESYIERRLRHVFRTEGWRKALQEDPDVLKSLFCSRCYQFGVKSKYDSSEVAKWELHSRRHRLAEVE